MGLTGRFLVASALAHSYCVYYFCRDNDGTNRGLCARSDVTRRLLENLFETCNRGDDQIVAKNVEVRGAPPSVSLRAGFVEHHDEWGILFRG